MSLIQNYQIFDHGIGGLDVNEEDELNTSLVIESSPAASDEELHIVDSPPLT